MEAQRGPRREFDFAERSIVVEHIDRAKLIEVQARMRLQHGLQNFRAQVDVFRTNERADAGAIVALLDLVPPALDLVAHHGWFFDEERTAGQ